MRKLVVAIGLTCASNAFAAEYKFAVVADAGKWNGNAESTRDSILNQGIDQLILPGDNLYSSSYGRVWSNWSSKGFQFSIVAIGNHNGGYSEEIRFFDMPGEYYSKVVGSVARFIVLNSDNNGNSAAQARFLDSELKNAKENFVFLVYHHPTFTLSHFHNWEEKRDFQNAVRPLLFKYREKITALFLGHDHLAMLAHFADLPVVMSGAIHETREDSPINNVQLGTNVGTDWYYDIKPHWAKLEFSDESDAATVTFFRSSNSEVRCVARINTGKPADLKDCHI